MAIGRASYDPPVPTSAVVQAGEVRLARIESVRALAALAVLTGHVWLFGNLDEPTRLIDTYPHRVLFGGGFGVFVFFGLSGYLLFWPFVRRQFGEAPPLDLPRYAINRVLRILPLYWFAVVFLLIVQNHGGTFELAWRHLLFVQSMWRDSLQSVDGSLWSVSVEIQFYALLPLVALAIARLSRRSARNAALLLIAAGLAGAGLRWYLIKHEHIHDPRVVYSMLTTSFFFVPGMVLALVRDLRLPRVLRSADLWVVASVPLWLWIFDDYARTPWAAVASFLVVGAAALPLTPGPLTRALDWRPLALVGVASYSLYLWHLPIIDSLARHQSRGLPVVLALGTALSLLVAFASYRFVEAPFLRLRRRWSSSS
jgi:peptidoglycan/LPS O-acetylase OafA/YrhL